jgi:hypothetical protein
MNQIVNKMKRIIKIVATMEDSVISLDPRKIIIFIL